MARNKLARKFLNSSFSVRHYIVGALLPDGEYLILAADKNPETALEEYKKWVVPYK